MEGFEAHTYGDAFADVYDDWYRDVSDVAATVARVVSLVGEGCRVLELGVGTGRLALPLARAGCRVTGVDASAAMLDRLAANDPEGLVTVVRGDMVDDIPDGPFDVVLIAYNTLFNLLDPARQHACLRRSAAVLVPGGHLVVEGSVPPDGDDRPGRASQVTVRSMTADRVVLSAAVTDGDRRAHGQFIEFSASGGVRLRPWAIRWSSPAELDAMAAAAGLVTVHRWSTMDATPFGPDSDQHVTVWRRLGDGGTGGGEIGADGRTSPTASA